MTEISQAKPLHHGPVRGTRMRSGRGANHRPQPALLALPVGSPTEAVDEPMKVFDEAIQGEFGDVELSAKDLLRDVGRPVSASQNALVGRTNRPMCETCPEPTRLNWNGSRRVWNCPGCKADSSADLR